MTARGRTADVRIRALVQKSRHTADVAILRCLAERRATVSVACVHAEPRLPPAEQL
jgi:hypothetical protein